jgi:hypothetical protein
MHNRQQLVTDSEHDNIIHMTNTCIYLSRVLSRDGLKPYLRNTLCVYSSVFSAHLHHVCIDNCVKYVGQPGNCCPGFDRLVATIRMLITAIK